MKIIMKIILGKADYHKNYHEHYPVKLSWAKQIVIEIIMKLTVKMMTMTKMMMLDDDSKYLSSANCCEKSTSSCKGEEKHLVIIFKFQDSSNNHFTTGTIEDTADLDINDNELEDQFYESSSLNDSFDVDSQFDENLCIPGLWSRVRQLKRGLASTSCRTNIE